MKSISATISLLLLILLLHLVTAIPPALDQRNRPPVVSEAHYHHRQTKARSSPKEQHDSDPVQNTNHDSLPGNIFCNVDDKSPLSGDVSEAIHSLRGGNGPLLGCNLDSKSGAWDCAHVAIFGSAAISYCAPPLAGRIDCGKIAEIAIAVSVKCEEECAGKLRISGMASMAWGNIFVLNSTTEPKVE